MERIETESRTISVDEHLS